MPTPTPPPSFNPRNLMALYVGQQYDELSRQLLTIWQHFAANTYGDLSAADQYFVNAFVHNFLYLFTQPDYVIGDSFVDPFIRFNLPISNVVAISSTKTTDACLEVLRNQERNFVKILTLWSARNTAQFDRRMLFDTEPVKASLWYSAYSEIYRTGLVRPEVSANLREHFRFRHPGLKPTYQCQEIYFGSTYAGGDVDRLIKPVVNEAIHELVVRPLAGAVVNIPNLRKIAVVSGFWTRGHPVCRGCSYYIKALRSATQEPGFSEKPGFSAGYHLTLLRLGGPKPDEDLSMFDDVKDLNVVNGELDSTPVLRNDFQLVFFPDVGMHPASILLANLRFAPIQVAGLGPSGQHLGRLDRLFHQRRRRRSGGEPRAQLLRAPGADPGSGAAAHVPSLHPRPQKPGFSKEPGF